MVSFGSILIFGALTAFPSVLANPRIIRGQEAAQGQFPWQVELLVLQPLGNELTACTGVLISEEWILTAAHCIYNARQIKIIAGAVNTSDPNAVTPGYREAIIHENYDSAFLRNDIGVVRLESPLTLNDDIRTVPLADKEPETGSKLTVSGWGYTIPSQQTYSQVLMYTTVTTIENSECEEYFGAEWIPPNVVCAVGGNPSTGPCFGDGGAPLVSNFDDDPAVVGIFSFLSGQGCERDFPRGYTRISVYRDWIEDVTGI